MATVREMTEIVAEMTGEPLSTVKLIARALLDEHLLPRAQGRRIPHVVGRDVAMLVLAIYASERIKSAASAAQTYAGLCLNGLTPPPDCDDVLLDCADIIGRLLDKVLRPDEAEPVEFQIGDAEVNVGIGGILVELVQSWPEVTITFPHGDRLEAARFVEPGKNPDFWQSSRPRRAVTIPSICLGRIAFRLRDIDDRRLKEAEIGDK